MTLGQLRFSLSPPSRLQRSTSGHDNVPGAHRVIGAAILAGGLALSVSVHPVQRSQGLLEALMPDGRIVMSVPGTVGSIFLKATSADFASINVPDLVWLVEFTDRHPEVSTGALLGLVNEFGIRNVVRSFELLSSMGPVRPLAPRVPYGGGGYWSNDGGGDALHSLMMALALLDGSGNFRGRELFEALRDVLTELMATVGRPPTPSAPASGPTDVSPTAVPSPLPSPSIPIRLVSDSPPDASTTDQPPAGNEPAATQITGLATVETSSPPTESLTSPIVAVSSAAAEPSVVVRAEPDPSPTDPPKPDPPKPDPPKTDPPKTDPPKPESTSSSGVADGPTGNTSSGSSSTSAGSSSGGDSAGGSAGSGDSGGGSSGGE
ncbi:hypothetical protein [Mycolicibacterium sp.]|uniref:hypothetical protein n=1 Tax=Mycolicibacterium sp. TaxID=2320850 RepID=UPI001A186D57|nr:hypothetical protein [Mycolicibacterium sp.]MBJ7337650.1 hypothetical protein [Mycolicibacterium sp.]